MQRSSHLLTLIVGGICLASGSGAAATPPKTPAQAEEIQRSFFQGDQRWCPHILAVDADGNALVPHVSVSADGRYSARHETLVGEDTRGANFAGVRTDELEPIDLLGYDRLALRNVLTGRRALYDYLESMFKAIEREQPDEIVVHVHGGLNNIDGAIAKTALISDDLEKRQPPDRRVFYIGICWNSDLYPTYKEHLFLIREGLRQPGKAIVTAPAMLLSDLGSAASRLPLDLINFLYQDFYTISPGSFKRTQLAQTRVHQIQARERRAGSDKSLTVSPNHNDRSRWAKRKDAGQWLLSSPTKFASTFLLDWLGTEPWKNMLRRTRTMFERESEFIPSIDEATTRRLAAQLSKANGQPLDADALLDKMNATGRQGAVSLFCSQAQGRLTGLTKRPTITLIGHSMGALVLCEILQRYHQLPLDNAVFMGAACSVNDFKSKVIPYLQEQNLRETLRAGILAELGRPSPASASASKTHFYNLCLHDTVENGEKNPGSIDLVQRGSLLTWIDLLYQTPESENDRTVGRWVNAILATDSLPGDVIDRITIKEFGVDRPLVKHRQLEDYAYRRGGETYVQEPMQHGDFSRFVSGAEKESTNLAFWRELYRISESAPSVSATPPRDSVTAGRRGKVIRAPQPRPAVIPAPVELRNDRDAQTGF